MDLLHLPGPQFLGWFLAFSVTVIVIVWMLRRRAEAGPVQKPDLPEDPYEIAFLTGGRNHTLEIALLALIDRGLLTVSGRNLKTADPTAIEKVRRPIDRAILLRFALGDNAAALFSDPVIKAEAEAIGNQIKAKRFMPDGRLELYRHALFGIGAVLLGALAVSKLVIALSEGRTNVGFLIIFTVAAIVVLWMVTHPSLTARGREVRADLKYLFSNLKSRARTLKLNSMTNELVLLGAVYGLTALPADANALLEPLNLNAAIRNDGRRGADGSSGGCGGGSCSGGSCGGGCGGGCGGCGG